MSGSSTNQGRDATSVSVIIPCYNSEKSLPELVERLTCVGRAEGWNFEIILVNDCSRDNTLIVLRDLVRQYPEIIAVDLMFNVGQFRALMCGFEYASGAFTVTMDDDLQHPPEEIPRLLDSLRTDDDCDVIFAKPDKREHPAYRNIGSFMIKTVNTFIFGKPRDLSMSAFRVMRRTVLETLLSHKTMFPVMGPIILKSTARIKNVTFHHEPRKYGCTNYSVAKLVQTTFDNVINFSSLPLKLISTIGLLALSFSISLSIYYLVRYFYGGIGVAGWTTTVLLINFYGGLLLFSVGVVGEYLIRILYEVSGSPRFRVRRLYRGRDDVCENESGSP